jgi:hypothetical protein
LRGNRIRVSNGRLAILLSMALLLLAFLAPACSEKTVSVDVDEIVAKALAAPSSLVSYQMDYSLSYDIHGTVDGQRVKADMTVDMTAWIDMTNRSMRLDMTIEMEDLFYPANGYYLSAQEYLVGHQLYIGGTLDAEEMEWTKKELPADFWERCQMVDQQVELLRSANREYKGQEQVDGVACDVLELTLDIDEVMDVYRQSSLLGDDVDFPDFTTEGTEDSKTTQWIARDTSRLVKGEVEMTLHMAAQDVDPSFSTGGIDMDVTGEMLFHHYNEPVSIEVPAAVIEQTS